MVINYVYNDKGVAEYVVIPTIIWNSVQEYLKKNNISNEIPEMPKEEEEEFNPRAYKGLLSSLDLDIEQELLNMKNAWKRSI